MSVLIAWCVSNQTLVAAVLFAISEMLGAVPKVKANGILSLILLQVQAQLKSKGAKDLTP